VGGSVFANGLALVNYEGHDYTYCIDKEGYVVFKIEKQNELSTAIDAKESIQGDFVYFIQSKSVYDIKGNLLKPEDYGVTRFYECGLANGHLFASVIESNFEGSTKKLGVMNNKFEWIVQPTEELFNAFFANDTLNYLYLGSHGFVYRDGVYYYDSRKYCLNIKDGTLSKYELEISDIEGIITYEELREKYPTLYQVTNFIDGKAAILFLNKDTNIFYVSMVDEKGQLLFNPIDVGDHYSPSIVTDGKTIILAEYSGWNLTSIDQNGKILAKLENLNKTLFSNDGQVNVKISDGVLHILNTYDNQTCYLTTDLKLLFQ